MHTYCKPNEAGLASEAKAVGKRLGELLDALGTINNWIIEPGELSDSCFKFKSDLISKLSADGWKVTIPGNRYIVKPERK